MFICGVLYEYLIVAVVSPDFAVKPAVLDDKTQVFFCVRNKMCVISDSEGTNVPTVCCIAQWTMNNDNNTRMHVKEMKSDVM